MSQHKHVRRIESIVEADLNKKMVILSGPRQCGKTFIAKSLVKSESGRIYNWDIVADKKLILSHKLQSDVKLWAFDELHKYRGWRNWLKGVYDEHIDTKKILVTGSAQLDAYSRGGDSLQGRYFSHRLHPFTLGELESSNFKSIDEIPQISVLAKISHEKAFFDLLKLGGFPEPLFSGSLKESNRWRLAYGDRVIREEIRSLEKIIELDKLELLLDRLPSAVGSPLSLNSFREDLDVSHDSMKKWVHVFDNLYLTFRISPYGTTRIKAVKKEQKLYFWDWARVEQESFRAENIVALHLLRLVHWAEDVEGVKLDLRYYRSTLSHEVDFLILKKGKPWIAIEIKSSEGPLHPGVKYLLEREKIPFAFQLHLHGTNDWLGSKINGTIVRFMPIYKFLAQLP